MAVHTLKRRLAVFGTALGLGIALPFAVGVTPAYAQVQLTITKTHTGTFTQGGQGVYHIVVTNAGDEPTSESGTEMTDILPEGSPPSPRSWSLHLPCSKGLSRHRSQEGRLPLGRAGAR